MGILGKWLIAVAGILLSLATPVYAQLGAGQQRAETILTSMPPDMLAKVQSLAQIIQQNIKDGKITDDEVKRNLMSGNLGERLKQLSPEAGQLLSDITQASKEGKGPGEESLMPLLGGLGISPE
ncbi:MAG: hypothetical protein KF890_00645 [Nitrospira sp.]|nr:hypothetical protein [Nitrospira sp.]